MCLFTKSTTWWGTSCIMYTVPHSSCRWGWPSLCGPHPWCPPPHTMTLPPRPCLASLKQAYYVCVRGPASCRGAEVSSSNIFSIACPKIKWFHPNKSWFLPENCHLKNSRGAVYSPLAPLPTTPMGTDILKFDLLFLLLCGRAFTHQWQKKRICSLMRKIVCYPNRVKENQISFNLIYHLLYCIIVLYEKFELEKVFTILLLLSVKKTYSFHRWPLTSSIFREVTAMGMGPGFLE